MNIPYDFSFSQVPTEIFMLSLVVLLFLAVKYPEVVIAIGIVSPQLFFSGNFYMQYSITIYLGYLIMPVLFARLLLMYWHNIKSIAWYRLPVVGTILLFVALHIFSYFINPALKGSQIYGLLRRDISMYLIIAFGTIFLASRKSIYYRFLKSVFFALIVTFTIAIIQVIILISFFDISFGLARQIQILGTKLYIMPATIGLIMSLLAQQIFRERIFKALSLLLLVESILILLISQTRIFFISSIIILVTLGFFKIKRIKLVVLTAVTLLILGILLPQQTTLVFNIFSKRISNIYQIGSDETFRMRLAYWKESYASFTERPIFGVGIGNSTNPTFRVIQIGLKNERELWSRPDPHNYYIRILGELGLIGISCFLLICAKTIALIKWVKRNGMNSDLSRGVFSMAILVILTGLISGLSGTVYYFFWGISLLIATWISEKRSQIEHNIKQNFGVQDAKRCIH